MIFIKRAEAPEIFTKEHSSTLEERLEAEAHYNQEPPPDKGFKFWFYSKFKNDYKEQLIKMFNSRCAYCECFVTVGSRGDIEHFRPKGEYELSDGQKKSPGYYTLASDWNNLYLSCTNCNQSTTFKILDAANPGKIIEKPAGKKNKFALSDEAFRRNRHPDKLAEEEPYRLLLDPCKDSPDEYLEFMADGTVKAMHDEGIKKKMAEYSIDVYALLREVLVAARKQRYLDIKKAINRVDRYSNFVLDDIKKGVNTDRHFMERQDVEDSLLELLDLLDVEKIPNEYIGLARQYIHPFLNEYCTRLQANIGPEYRNEPWYPTMRSYLDKQIRGMKAYFENRESLCLFLCVNLIAFLHSILIM